MSFSRSLRLGLRLALLAQVFVLGVAAQSLAGRLHPPLTRRLPVPFHRAICRILGIRIVAIGALPPPGTLLVGNHISWLDIPVLASLAPLSFIAKSEVAGWPLFGMLSRLQNTVFVDRQKRIDTGRAAIAISGRLQAGERIVLFAEGTTGDGHRVLPFRSALIGAAHGAEDTAAVIPFAIRYARRNGLPLTRRDMPEIAWYGDMELLPHLKALLGSGPADVIVCFGAALTPADGADRKAIARIAEDFARKARRAN